jgi:molecular chaperone IbpA
MEDMEMRTYDFAPWDVPTSASTGCSTSSTMRTLSEASDTYPPYDIVRTGSDSFRISLAVAGFAPENLRIVAQQNLLTVAGEKGRQRPGIPLQKYFRPRL